MTRFLFRSFSLFGQSRFPGASGQFTSELSLSLASVTRPTFQLLNPSGVLHAGTQIVSDSVLGKSVWFGKNHAHSKDISRSEVEVEGELKLSFVEIVEMYKTMVTVNVMDDVFYNAQRQGRISFYMQNTGEEAVQIGSARAITLDDVIFAQYREAGVFLYRGMGLKQMADQCFSNVRDLGKGRQMPIHYGDRKINLQTISSPLGTQLPQATGAAYALKMSKSGNCVICYFGEGAASEGDFHPALNFAATLECPVIFFCRNNGFAISTPSTEQYRGDGIVSRADGYGMTSIRVDGNDLLAVYEATKRARDYAVQNNRPVLIEAMCYRGGHHSTSDDSTRYRAPSEIQYWAESDNPVTRVRLFLEQQNEWDSNKESLLREIARKDVLEAFNQAENVKKPPVSELFADVYDDIPVHLQKQRTELRQHLEKYGKHYNLSEYEESEDTKGLL